MKLFYQIKEIKNQESQIEKLTKEKNEMDIQIKNFKREKMIEEIHRKKESTELLENYLKTLDDLNVANEKIKTLEEKLYTKLILNLNDN